MIAMVRELFHHQAHADASMLMAIKSHDVASNDDELRKLSHHILIAHRYWLHLGQGLPFSVEAESILPDTLQELIARFQATHQQEGVWLDQLTEADMARVMESPYFPDRQVTLGQALTQVCLHSQGHRAQCAARFRTLGGEPPPTDYILWVKDRPSPVWV